MGISDKEWNVGPYSPQRRMQMTGVDKLPLWVESMGIATAT